MGSLEETNPSLWIGTTGDADEYPTVTAPASFDVIVVGAGIAGLTTARLLVDEGATVAVLDAGRIAAGATGYTTAKFTALQRVTLSEVRSRHGDEHAAVYAAANAAAVERVAQLVADDQIECDFARASACTYAVEQRAADAIDAEYEALLAAGLPARRGDADELPFEVTTAVWLDDQVQLHPRRYCLGIARSIIEHGGGVFEHSRVLGVTEDDGACTVTLESGELTADQVMVATHLPFTHSGGYFARAHPYRSYALAARLQGAQITGMYISVDEPTRSIRAAPDGWTVLGGEGHKVGHDDDTRRRYEALEDWARTTFDIQEVGWRWSAQDYETVDGLPYVGRLSAASRQVWTATGFRKWGMSNGTAAAMIIADRIAGRDNSWSKTFDSTRLAVGASIKHLITENLEVGKRFVADRIASWRPAPADDLEAGEGGVGELAGKTVAAFRDEEGRLHAVAATCTHLGCRLAFNTAERSWDCPCHGSRFDVDGHVLEGPAVTDLAPIDDH